MWVPRAYAEIDQAIGSAEETTQLDFKQELGKSRDIAKDIASMTIDGGVLVYGVKEKNGVAVAITPVPLSGTVERIQQIADSAVHPPPAIETEAVKANPGDGEGVVVVVVAASPLAPHMANDRYPARSGTTTRYLAELEIERLYEQRRGLAVAGETREPLGAFMPPEGVSPPATVFREKAVGTLRIFVEPVVAQRHPHGASLRLPLAESVRFASETLAKLVSAKDSDSQLLAQLRQWEPRGTLGWKSGHAAETFADLEHAVVLCAATYTHSGDFSFEVSTVIDINGRRCAWEYLWALEAMAALAFTGSFYGGISGVSFVDVDLNLMNLEGAIATKAFKGAYSSHGWREVADANYIESRRFAVAEFAKDPSDATRELLDRLFASFLGDGTDVVGNLA
jgi:hypothetical protein